MQASDRVEGNSASQKRKRLSGKLLTNVIDSSASGGGGRISSLWRVARMINSLLIMRVSLSSREFRLIIIMLASCLGVEKLEQEILRVRHTK